MSNPRRFLEALLVGLFLVAAPALAQPPKPKVSASATISGDWVFETKLYSEGCRLTGRLRLGPGATPATCSLTARETCPGFSAAAEQTCIATRTGADLVITSTVRSVKPPSTSYVPDNFTLTIHNGAHMSGMLRSFNSAPAEFRRPATTPIS